MASDLQFQAATPAGEHNMGTINSNSDTPTLGETIAAACDMGGIIASDPTLAAELGGRHLERVLVRACNARLAAALATLAMEFTPEVPRVERSRPAVGTRGRARTAHGAHGAHVTRAA